tara:strand:+ start:56 stop:280 length:225 start_codon:yes stop_codon:yes gene_type:complete
MKKRLTKIDKETDDGAFEVLFRDGNWGLDPGQILPIFTALIKQHNEMIDFVNGFKSVSEAEILKNRPEGYKPLI